MKKVIIIILVLAVVGGGYYYFNRTPKAVKQIDLNKETVSNDTAPKNEGPVSPISGLACDNWNRRPFAIMQPSDASTRPLNGLSDADMVVEMPAVYGSITRLMAIYVCGNPEKLGSLRSARHDYLPIAAGMDAIYVHWGGSHFALDKLKEGIMDDLNCNNDGGQSAGKYCYRETREYLSQKHDFPSAPIKGDDTGYVKFADLIQASKDFNYRLENKFSGYPHQDEAPIDQRPSGGNLHVGYPATWSEDFAYDKDTNSFKRTWGGVLDSDRNNGKNITPKNVVVMIADGAQMESQYANFQVGDPWYDDGDSGVAYYYINGKETKGTWKKNKSDFKSKLTFFDASGQEMKFVPGQIWVNIVDPGISVKWEPAA